LIAQGLPIIALIAISFSPLVISKVLTTVNRTISDIRRTQGATLGFDAYKRWFNTFQGIANGWFSSGREILRLEMMERSFFILFLKRQNLEIMKIRCKIKDYFNTKAPIKIPFFH
jgi:hypothetical protein